MKRLKKILVVLIAWCSIQNLMAYDFVVDGIAYNITSEYDRTVEVTGASGGMNEDFYIGHIIVPSTVTYHEITYTVTALGKNAFKYSSVETLSLPSTLREIKIGALTLCNKLKSLNIPEGIETIEKDVVGLCEELESISFPSTMKSFDPISNLSSCPQLKSIVIHPDNPVYDSRDKCNAVIETKTSSLIRACKGTTIPPTVTTLAKQSFKNILLDSLYVPETVEFISAASIEAKKVCAKNMNTWCGFNLGTEPYAGSINLRNSELYLDDKLIVDAIIPNSVKTIQNFYFYTKLRSVSIPPSALTVIDKAFYGCSNLIQVVVDAPEPPKAFEHSFSDETYRSATLYVPTGTKSIYAKADGWRNFQNIIDDEEPEDISNVNSYFESGGYRYHVVSVRNKEVEIVPDKTESGQSDNSRYKGDIVIPPTVIDNGITYTVTRLGENFLNGRSGEITSVKIPRTIKEIGIEFQGSYNIYIEDIAAWCDIKFMINKNDDYYSYPQGSFLPSPNMKPNNLYVNGQLVTDLIIPEGVTSISDAAFMGFAGIKSVTFPASVTHIGTQAFCLSALERVTIPATVKTINMGAFSGCFNMTSLTIEDGVKEIGSSAFADCLNLKKVSIPASVKSIKDFAFRWCKSLEELTLADGLESIGEWSFYQCENLKRIDVPSTTKTIGRNAFNACKKLESVHLPEGLKTIDRYAFTNCSSLEKLEIPASVTYIGRNMVEDCPKLKTLTIAEGNPVYDTHGNNNAIFEKETNSIIAVSPNAEIPEGIETIGNYAFAYCSDRQSVILPEGIKTIGDCSFLHCWSLHTITFPESTEYIGYKAFDSCESIEEVIAKASSPCEMEDDAFSNETYQRATLYVPDETIDSYREAEGWKRFAHIEGMSVYIAGIEPIAYQPNGNFEIKFDGHRVLLYNLNASERVRVYSLDGILVKDVTAAPDGRAVLMFTQRGTYIVKTQSKSIKINL